jgi:hypothetical protein
LEDCDGKAMILMSMMPPWRNSRPSSLRRN